MDLKIRNVQRTRSQLISELKLTREIQQKKMIFWHETKNDDIIKLHYDLQKYTKRPQLAGCGLFLRSYRLTGRLTVFFILVKPFADVVCGYVYHDQENEFFYDLHGIYLPPSCYI